MRARNVSGMRADCRSCQASPHQGQASDTGPDVPNAGAVELLAVGILRAHGGKQWPWVALNRPVVVVDNDGVFVAHGEVLALRGGCAALDACKRVEWERHRAHHPPGLPPRRYLPSVPA